VCAAVSSGTLAPHLWSIYASSPGPWHHDAVLVALMLPGLFATMSPALALPASRTLARSGSLGPRPVALLVTVIVGVTVSGAGEARRWQRERRRTSADADRRACSGFVHRTGPAPFRAPLGVVSGKGRVERRSVGRHPVSRTYATADRSRAALHASRIFELPILGRIIAAQ
jgi:hypothetical protein